VRDREIREIRAHGANLESLLAHWIGECCYVYEVEGFGCCAVEFPVFEVEARAGGEPLRLHALGRGEVPSGRAGGPWLGPTQALRLRQLADGYEIGFSVEM